MRCRALALLAVAASGLVAAGCGSDDNGSSGGGGGGGGEKPARVGMQIILDKTGIASFANIEADKGVRLAIEQINSSDFLGGTKVVPTYSDAASDQRQAVQRVSKAVKQNPAVVVFAGGRVKHMTVAMNDVLREFFGTVDVTHARQKARVLIARSPRGGPGVPPATVARLGRSPR